MSTQRVMTEAAYANVAPGAVLSPPRWRIGRFFEGPSELRPEYIDVVAFRTCDEQRNDIRPGNLPVCNESYMHESRDIHSR